MYCRNTQSHVRATFKKMHVINFATQNSHFKRWFYTTTNRYPNKSRAVSAHRLFYRTILHMLYFYPVVRRIIVWVFRRRDVIVWGTSSCRQPALSSWELYPSTLSAKPTILPCRTRKLLVYRCINRLVCLCYWLILVFERVFFRFKVKRGLMVLKRAL